jgi:hypothetical protein
MNTKSKMVITLIAGIALGAAAVQGLHAQTKPKAYIVTESEVLDAAALAAYRPKIVAAIQAAGARLSGAELSCAGAARRARAAANTSAGSTFI